MNRSKKLFFLPILLFVLGSCIDDGAEEFIDFTIPGFEVYTYINADTLENLKKQEAAVYIEDFTGNNCVNCPEAAEYIKGIEEKYKGRIVTVAIHAGTESFVAPKAGYAKYDFRSKQGSSIASMLGASGALPEGAIDRVVHTGEEGIVSQKRFLWESYADSRIDKTTPVGLYADIIEITSDTLIAQVLVAYHEDVDDEKHFISAYLTESGVIDNQYGKDGDVKDYEHNHIFRTSLGTFSGNELVGSYETGRLFRWTYRASIKQNQEGEQYKTGWNPEKLSLVAFVHKKTDAEFEVIHAIEEHL